MRVVPLYPHLYFTANKKSYLEKSHLVPIEVTTEDGKKFTTQANPKQLKEKADGTYLEVTGQPPIKVERLDKPS